jgi:hypothetical protein
LYGRPAQVGLVERDAPHRVGADTLVLQLVEVVPLLILLVRANRVPAKNQSLSRMIGPPNAPPVSIVLLEGTREAQAPRAQLVVEVVGLK